MWHSLKDERYRKYQAKELTVVTCAERKKGIKAGAAVVLTIPSHILPYTKRKENTKLYQG